jgi:hypothetical protein
MSTVADPVMIEPPTWGTAFGGVPVDSGQIAKSPTIAAG